MRLLVAVAATLVCLPWHYLLWQAWGWMAAHFGPAQPAFSVFAAACGLATMASLLLLGESR